MDWTTACPDWERRIIAGESLLPCGPLFPKEAEQPLDWFDGLRLLDVTGRPTMGEACRPWIRDLVAVLFGAWDRDSGRRLITEYFVSVSKKNGKSTIAGGLMLTALIWNWRESAEFLILAPTVEIANNSFGPVRDMIRADPELSALMYVQDHIRTITNRRTNSTLKVVAADSETVGGKKATGILIDELWQFGKKPHAESMFMEAVGGLASRPEGFVVYLTTQSDDQPAGVFLQKLRYARSVRDGEIVDKQFLPLIYEFPRCMLEAGRHKDPANFYVTNPNLGASVAPEFLVRKLQLAENDGEESLRIFLSKHLNVEIGQALKFDRWAGADFWMQSKRKVSFNDLIERCEVVTVGVDGGGLDDWLGLAAVGREEKTGDWLHWAHAWAHPIVLERRKSEAGRFRDFERDGDLTIVSDIGRDVEELANYVKQLDEAGVLDRVGVDQAGIGAVLDALAAVGIAHDRIIGISQGWRLVGAIKTTERRLAEGAFHHGHSPMMGWCVGNARVEPRGNAILITKQIAGSAKIDPLMATFNAVSLMAMNPQPRKKNYRIFFV